MTLPDPEVPLVYSLHYVQQGHQDFLHCACPRYPWGARGGHHDYEDELPPETMGRMKKQEKGNSNFHAEEDFCEKRESMNLDPRLIKLIQKYHEVCVPLVQPLSCKKLVQMDLKSKPEFEGSVVRRRPYPAPQDQIEEIKRHIQECIDAGLVRPGQPQKAPFSAKNRCWPCLGV